MSSLDYLGLLLEFKNKYNIKIAAVDIIEPKRVKNRYPNEWLDDIFSIPITTGDIIEIQFPEEKYDAVTCISTIEHIGFDKTTIENLKTTFDRKLKPEEVIMNRSTDTNNAVLDKIHTILKPSGKLLISAPAGKGGAILLQDSLGYYCAEWEYEKNSWNEIVLNPKFKLIEQNFFKFNEEGLWEKVNDINSLVNQDSSYKRHAQGCGIALLMKK